MKSRLKIEALLMKTAKSKLEWGVVYLDSDFNWWVNELSEKEHWDTEEPLSIIDPRQMSYLLDLIEGLRDYGFQHDYLENAFFKFSIDKELTRPKDHIRLVRCNESHHDAEEPLFWLPNNMDEEKGPYAELLDHITQLQVKMLNDLHTFKQMLTVDDLEEEIREKQNADFLEGRSSHSFQEIRVILEYIPAGAEVYFDEDDDTFPAKETPPEDLIPDDDTTTEEDSSKETEFIEEYEAMVWDEDEDEGGKSS